MTALLQISGLHAAYGKGFEPNLSATVAITLPMGSALGGTHLLHRGRGRRVTPTDVEVVRA